jgi:flagellar hook assembly protein FlgD
VTIPLRYAVFQAPEQSEAPRFGSGTPNPFRASTIIEYSLARSAEVRLGVYDVAGRIVRQLVQSPHKAGSHTAVWDGRDAYGRYVADGVYFYRLVVEDYTQTRKIIYLK